MPESPDHVDKKKHQKPANQDSYTIHIATPKKTCKSHCTTSTVTSRMSMYWY